MNTGTTTHRIGDRGLQPCLSTLLADPFSIDRATFGKAVDALAEAGAVGLSWWTLHEIVLIGGGQTGGGMSAGDIRSRFTDAGLTVGCVEAIYGWVDAVTPAEAVADDRRPMFSANLALEMPTQPHLALWHATTLLREHRGDGHLVALAALEVGPCEAHVLRLAHTGAPIDTVQPFRGWTDDDWIGAVGRLHERGVLDDAGHITETGAALHVAIEELTDRLATAPLRSIQSELAELAHILAPVVQALDSTVVPYPNPMGVERFDTA